MDNSRNQAILNHLTALHHVKNICPPFYVFDSLSAQCLKVSALVPDAQAKKTQELDDKQPRLLVFRRGGVTQTHDADIIGVKSNDNKQLLYFKNPVPVKRDKIPDVMLYQFQSKSEEDQTLKEYREGLISDQQDNDKWIDGNRAKVLLLEIQEYTGELIQRPPSCETAGKYFQNGTCIKHLGLVEDEMLKRAVKMEKLPGQAVAYEVMTNPMTKLPEIQAYWNESGRFVVPEQPIPLGEVPQLLREDLQLQTSEPQHQELYKRILDTRQWQLGEERGRTVLAPLEIAKLEVANPVL
jgi:hypothetical protein